MKKITLLFSLLFIGLTTVSCSSDDDNNNLPEGGYLTYTLPQDEQIIITRFARSGEEGGTNYVLTDGSVLSINAAKDDSRINIIFPYNGLGTYNDIAFRLYNGNIYFNVNENYESNGEVTIAEIDTQNETISGTFSFIGYNDNNTLEVTQGEFNNLPYIGTLPTNAEKKIYENERKR